MRRPWSGEIRGPLDGVVAVSYLREGQLHSERNSATSCTTPFSRHSAAFTRVEDQPRRDLAVGEAGQEDGVPIAIRGPVDLEIRVGPSSLCAGTYLWISTECSAQTLPVELGPA